MKMLPVVDTFREAPKAVVATTEREESMHKNFGSLNNQILTAFTKFGYTEYNPGVVFLRSIPFHLFPS
jgi:molecular chaperone GrpE (heat shock protein)